jgi:H+/Cl- antiporter ClcA
MTTEWGKALIFLGIIIVIIGAILILAGEKLSWLGNLPGDIKVEKENFRFYFPWVTMLLISIMIHLLVRLYKWLF